MSYSKLQNITYTIKVSGGDSRKMHPFAIDIIMIHPFGREIAVKEAVAHKRAKVGGPMVFGDGFRVCRADAETGHKCQRRQGRSPRQVADGQWLRREIRVFPPRAQQSLRTTEATTLMRASGESVGFMEQCGINHTVSPLGAKRPTLPALGRFERLGAEPEERQ